MFTYSFEDGPAVTLAQIIDISIDDDEPLAGCIIETLVKMEVGDVDYSEQLAIERLS